MEAFSNNDMLSTAAVVYLLTANCICEGATEYNRNTSSTLNIQCAYPIARLHAHTATSSTRLSS